MAAAFPQSIKSFSNKVDLVNTVLADHVNALQDEVRAISIAITGNPSTNILTSSYSGVFANTVTWTSVDERLNNIEAGLVNGVATSPYFKKSGDSVQPAAGRIPAPGRGRALGRARSACRADVGVRPHGETLRWPAD